VAKEVKNLGMAAKTPTPDREDKTWTTTRSDTSRRRRKDRAGIIAWMHGKTVNCIVDRTLALRLPTEFPNLKSPNILRQIHYDPEHYYSVVKHSVDNPLIAKSVLSTIALLVLVVAAVVGFVSWKSSKSPVDLSTLRQLTLGATRDDVKRLFGAPQDVHDLYGDHRWCYYRTNSTRIVYVIFDTNMLYKGFELDD
jgi:hypothetical protein